MINVRVWECGKEKEKKEEMKFSTRSILHHIGRKRRRKVQKFGRSERRQFQDELQFVIYSHDSQLYQGDTKGL